ncbi:transposase [Nostoc sp.]|uniref:transposase n=1 Tax=Nostoc sp. TaxID=1180 RepID=UPI003FA53B55
MLVLQYIHISDAGSVKRYGKKFIPYCDRFQRAVTPSQLRKIEGRDVEPSAGIIDSQTVKTTEKGGIDGYDAGKKINGRKRHILVDTMGLLLIVVVHAASIQVKYFAIFSTRLKNQVFQIYVFAINLDLLLKAVSKKTIAFWE